MARRSRFAHPRFTFTALAIAAACSSGTLTSVAATSGTVVGAVVPSATNLSIAACAEATPATTIGTVLPGASAITSADCAVTFGSSNDTASLRIAQRDGDVRAMYRPVVGGLNTAFGTAGRTTSATGTGADLFTAVARDANGLFVAVGSYYNGTRNKLVVARYLANGTLDPSFNGGAVRTISVGSTDDVAYSVAVQADRKIVLVGNSNNDSLVMRLNVDGTTDWTQVNNLGSGTDWAKGVAIQPDGQVLVTGIAYTGAGNVWNLYLERRSPTTGALDTSFGTGGRVVSTSVITAATPRITVAPPLVHTDGRITFCDYTTSAGNPDLWVLRTLANGTLDGTFGVSGKMTVAGADSDFCGPGGIQADGKVVFPSATTNGSGVGSVRAVRIRTDGTLDPAFGSSGVASAPTLGDAYIGTVLVQEDGAVLATGLRRATTTYTGIAIRWSSSGTLDLDVGPGGFTTMDIGSPTIPPSGGATVWGADGMPLTASGFWNGSNLDLVVYQLATTTIPDYGGATTWASASGAFGACLRAVAGAGATAVWTPAGTCSVVDDGRWYPVPRTTGTAGALVARSTTATATGTQALLRFGLRTSLSQPAGTYVAPLTFETVAPLV